MGQGAMAGPQCMGPCAMAAGRCGFLASVASRRLSVFSPRSDDCFHLPRGVLRMGLDKVIDDAVEAVADLPHGASLAVGGFGLCGIPSALIHALLERRTGGLHVVSNNCGVDDWGLGLLLREGLIARMTSSYVGENKEFARQYLGGELELELVPQGTLAERLRAGGAGIPAFYTPAGVGTQIAEGGIAWRHHPDGSVAVAAPPKETRIFHEREYLLEEGITTDFALVRAAVGDRHGNLVFHASARNFNPLAAMAGRITVAEVEELVEPGAIPPGEVQLPGVFVQRVVPVAADDPAAEKRIERRTVRPGAETGRAVARPGTETERRTVRPVVEGGR